MNYQLIDDRSLPQGFPDPSCIDPALPGTRNWSHWIPNLHRALAGHFEAVPLPRFRPDMGENGCAYWETAVYLLDRLVGWPVKTSMGKALRWWLREGCPTFDDPRLTLLKDVWNDQDQLGLLAIWAWQFPAAPERDDYPDADVVTRMRRKFDWNRFGLPVGGGWNSLHLGHSLANGDDPKAVLMTPRPANLRAALFVDHMNDWHRTLSRVGATLPPMSPNHWKIDVVVPAVGVLGTFRRSDTTGLWFQGKHSVHTCWMDGG